MGKGRSRCAQISRVAHLRHAQLYGVFVKYALEVNVTVPSCTRFGALIQAHLSVSHLSCWEMTYFSQHLRQEHKTALGSGVEVAVEMRLSVNYKN